MTVTRRLLLLSLSLCFACTAQTTTPRPSVQDATLAPEMVVDAAVYPAARLQMPAPVLPSQGVLSSVQVERPLDWDAPETPVHIESDEAGAPELPLPAGGRLTAWMFGPDGSGAAVVAAWWGPRVVPAALVGAHAADALFIQRFVLADGVYVGTGQPLTVRLPSWEVPTASSAVAPAPRLSRVGGGLYRLSAQVRRCAETGGCVLRREIWRFGVAPNGALWSAGPEPSAPVVMAGPCRGLGSAARLVHHDLNGDGRLDLTVMVSEGYALHYLDAAGGLRATVADGAAWVAQQMARGRSARIEGAPEVAGRRLRRALGALTELLTDAHVAQAKTPALSQLGCWIDPQTLGAIALDGPRRVELLRAARETLEGVRAPELVAAKAALRRAELPDPVRAKQMRALLRLFHDARASRDALETAIGPGPVQIVLPDRDFEVPRGSDLVACLDDGHTPSGVVRTIGACPLQRADARRLGTPRVRSRGQVEQCDTRCCTALRSEAIEGMLQLRWACFSEVGALTGLGLDDGAAP